MVLRRQTTLRLLFCFVHDNTVCQCCSFIRSKVTEYSDFEILFIYSYYHINTYIILLMNIIEM
jgi:hypothetical protein